MASVRQGLILVFLGMLFLVSGMIVEEANRPGDGRVCKLGATCDPLPLPPVASAASDTLTALGALASGIGTLLTGVAAVTMARNSRQARRDVETVESTGLDQDSRNSN